MQGSLWRHCLAHLEAELPEQQFNTWIRPLRVNASAPTGELRLQAPNRF
ncbi:MAG: chromosomal replication initiator protein DnaA, partial [Xanthomonadaceae bacterium]|nr:chromosomal replication initiator protein DnaA [Xanthomonadaceae bacterium]